MRYGVPLVSTTDYYEHVQIAIVDDQLQDAYSVLRSADFHDDSKGSRWIVSDSCTNNNTTGDHTCTCMYFVSMSSVHVELFAGFDYCRLPAGAFDRAVTTVPGSSNRLPLLQDLLLSLKRSKLEPIKYDLGGVFASMLIDVYRLDEDWIMNALSAINDDKTVCRELIEVISRQRKAFRETKPTGWVLQKFFTNGRPLTQPLYQAVCGGGQKPLTDWPPRTRVDWVYDDPSACGNEREEGEGRSNQSWSKSGSNKRKVGMLAMVIDVAVMRTAEVVIRMMLMTRMLTTKILVMRMLMTRMLNLTLLPNYFSVQPKSASRF